MRANKKANDHKERESYIAMWLGRWAAFKILNLLLHGQTELMCETELSDIIYNECLLAVFLFLLSIEIIQVSCRILSEG